MKADFTEYPEYVEALERESFLRDSAFIGLPESVAGFELRPMSLRDWITLRITRSPFLHGTNSTLEDLCRFLWLQSVDFSHNERARKRFYKRCREFSGGWTKKQKQLASLRFTEAALACRSYVLEALMDMPGGKKTEGFEPSYYSDGAFMCGLLGREFGYSREDVLSMPLKQLWQLISEIKDTAAAKNGERAVLFNPISDRVRREIAKEMNRK